MHRIENRLRAQESRFRRLDELPIRWQFAVDPIDSAINGAKDSFWVVNLLISGYSPSRKGSGQRQSVSVSR